MLMLMLRPMLMPILLIENAISVLHGSREVLRLVKRLLQTNESIVTVRCSRWQIVQTMADQMVRAGGDM